MKVLVTGGSRGIGKSIVDIFKKNKHDVWSPTREQLDLSSSIQLTNRNFDVIINNAGINPLNSVIDNDNEIVMRVNYTSPLEIIKQCLPYMINQKYGRIINIGSIWINIAKPKRSAYSASKNALHSLTMALAAEYTQHNILTNTISPGFIATDLTYQNNTNDQLEQIIEDIPIRRLGHPDEVAKLVYMMTVDNSFISGQNIIIDGGYSCTTR